MAVQPVRSAAATCTGRAGLLTACCARATVSPWGVDALGGDPIRCDADRQGDADAAAQGVVRADTTAAAGSTCSLVRERSNSSEGLAGSMALF